MYISCRLGIVSLQFNTGFIMPFTFKTDFMYKVNLCVSIQEKGNYLTFYMHFNII